MAKTQDSRPIVTSSNRCELSMTSQGSVVRAEHQSSHVAPIGPVLRPTGNAAPRGFEGCNISLTVWQALRHEFPHSSSISLNIGRSAPLDRELGRRQARLPPNRRCQEILRGGSLQWCGVAVSTDRHCDRTMRTAPCGYITSSGPVVTEIQEPRSQSESVITYRVRDQQPT